MSATAHHSFPTSAVTSALVAAGYWLCGLFVTHFFADYGLQPAPLWLPAALGFIACWTYGRSAVIGVLLGSLAINHINQGLPLFAALALSMVNATATLWGVQALQGRGTTQLPFYALADVRHFVVRGALLSALPPAIAGGLTLLCWKATPLAEIPQVVLHWWISDALAILLFAPVGLLWMFPVTLSERALPVHRIEQVLLLLSTLLMSSQVLYQLSNPHGLLATLPALLIVPILWASVRLPLRFAHALAALVSLTAIIGASTERGVFFITSNGQALTSALLLLLAQMLTLLALGALVMERRRAEWQLGLANRTLEHKVNARTRALSDSEERCRQLAESAPFPLVMCRLDDGTISYANSRACDLFGRRLEQLTSPPKVFDCCVDASGRQRLIGKLRRGYPIHEMEMELRTLNGKPFWAQLSCTPIQFDSRSHVLISINDISQRHQLECTLQASNKALHQKVDEIESLQQILSDQARRDPLTGLYNRRELDLKLYQLCQKLHSSGSIFSVLILDVDHFKQINDRYGHQVGDAVLVALAKELQRNNRADDVVCRFGGEEFVLIQPGMTEAQAVSKAEYWRKHLASLPIHTAAGTLTITVSQGLAIAPLHGIDPDTLLGAADAALYRAKQSGRNRVCLAQ